MSRVYPIWCACGCGGRNPAQRSYLNATHHARHQAILRQSPAFKAQCARGGRNGTGDAKRHYGPRTSSGHEAQARKGTMG